MTRREAELSATTVSAHNSSQSRRGWQVGQALSASWPAAVRQTASEQQHLPCRSTASQSAAACSQPASEPASSSSSKPAASQSVSQSGGSSQPASQPRAAPAASLPASRPAAEPASLSTALFFAALLCSTSPPAETRLTVCRRSQHLIGVSRWVHDCLWPGS